MFSSVNAVQLVTCMKLLDVWIQDNLRADRHVDYKLREPVNIFLMKRLRDQGLALKYRRDAFQAIVVTRTCMPHALSARWCFMSKELTTRSDALIKRCYRYGLTSKIEHVDVFLIRFVWICSS